ncbi:cytoplasmic tRNA 2-thiolation protein 1, putative [Plasmodium berghei]|uniref:Cytoplasmic tRNA 2-thiolation protein 1 n=2 Tax=Plasmodium berghei TaxID=5821 RepID=A0A509ADR4_PLABA|nr:cytoplasmic tRNA 2-thiolation protein 1, putative [Plasmodium berghei ANKA]CXH83164.1 cytoplasmic tRNA 2-thiolation protein 1, putative [Plasmodium berghei]SCM19258.1 cytoplasmic tRNA 2-thiolation protein 1, putative [Plasmodium berghei]SCN21692.1 cytoplasmic tRNA 2-thiolation protein 1, putative [Plasmodium berghei]SCO58922.1 cytoplasmic tRNA 2-thiolation protein 1, putative [Plasmodium berghei]SCO58978.1 cytoplasmic tRNA 2-thiolation protein 1, putative [Plasmodium berghei]|eukprot:XP_034419709.1 cytoplasmic tRNA 2-thiolation protein 1, putative [Plasmodium berghei ANKA]
MLCEQCNKNNVCILKPSNKEKLCKYCFLESFEDEVHTTILKKKMFEDNDKICIAVSGGKDSSVLTHVLVNIKKKYNYNWNLFLLAIDEGIKGYRDDSLKVVYKLEKLYNLPLSVLKFQDIFSYTMDDVVSYIGKKNNCTVCGVFRRQAMEKGALLFNATKLVTGHNADDLAETILMNMCRGDIDKLAKNINDFMQKKKNNNSSLTNYSENSNTNVFSNSNNVLDKNEVGSSSCVCKEKISIQSNKEMEKKNKCNDDIAKISNDNTKYENKGDGFIPRLKPLMWSYEKEIVLYAYHLKLDFFSTECTYSPNSFRGNLRSFIKDLEIINPQIILNIIHSSEFFYFNTNIKKKLNTCIKCGAYTSNVVCKACLIVDGLNNYTDNSFLYANKKKKNNKKKISIEYEIEK